MAPGIRLESVDPSEGVLVETPHAIGTGWVSLQVVPGEGHGDGELATLVLTPLAAGTVPLVLGGDSVVTANNGTVPLDVSGATVGIVEQGGDGSDPAPSS